LFKDKYTNYKIETIDIWVILIHYKHLIIRNLYS